ncbi:extensin, partial [Streptomyces seoulensis]
MADEQYRWLDRDTAERLLRGEPLDTVDPAVRDQAERLARALNALAADPYADAPQAAAELPGEAAALAAFRKATADRTDARTSPYDAYRPTPAPAPTNEPATPSATPPAAPGSVDASSAVTGPVGAGPAAAGPDHVDAVDVADCAPARPNTAGSACRCWSARCSCPSAPAATWP